MHLSETELCCTQAYDLICDLCYSMYMTLSSLLISAQELITVLATSTED